MNRRLMLACVAVAGTLAVTARLHAQSPWTVGFGAGAAREILHSRFGSAQTRLSGSLLSMEALATRGRFVARLRYGQGRVRSDTAARDVVQGEALVGYQARPWLALWLGPRARTFVASGLSDRRWLVWSGALSARGGIFPGARRRLRRVMAGVQWQRQSAGCLREREGRGVWPRSNAPQAPAAATALLS